MVQRNPAEAPGSGIDAEPRSQVPFEPSGMSTNLNVVVHRLVRIFDGFFKIDEATVSYDMLMGDGRMERVRLEVFERGDSVAALLHDTDTDEVLLVEQFRFPTYRKGPGLVREVIAGGIEAGETPEQAITREIEEETGYRPERLAHVHTFYVSPGGSSERILMFHAEMNKTLLVNPAASGLTHKNENTKTLRIRRDDFIRQALSGHFVDAKTLIAAHWLAAKGRRRR